MSTSHDENCTKTVVISRIVPFIICSSVYLTSFVFSRLESCLLVVILKCLPIIMLMGFVLVDTKDLTAESKNLKIFIGLFFSAIGDAFLVWPHYFLYGMIAFSVTQISYISALGFQPLNLKIGLILYAATAFALSILIPHLNGVFIVGVPLYSILLVTMTWRSIVTVKAAIEGEPKIKWYSMKYFTGLGGVYWLISDAVLGFDIFYNPIPYAPFIIMSTYYAGQLGIALSIFDRETQLLNDKRQSVKKSS